MCLWLILKTQRLILIFYVTLPGISIRIRRSLQTFKNRGGTDIRTFSETFITPKIKLILLSLLPL